MTDHIETQKRIIARHLLLIDHTETQKRIIARHLLLLGHITSLRAFTLYNITRLAEVIRRLKKDGYSIESVTEYDQNNKSRHWAKYELIKTK